MQHLSGRSDNAVKNRWHVLVRTEESLPKATLTPFSPSINANNAYNAWNSASFDSGSSDAYSSDVYDIPPSAPASYSIPTNAPASYSIPMHASSSGYGFAHQMAPINHARVSSANDLQSYSQSGSAYLIPCTSSIDIDAFISNSVHTSEGMDEQSHSSRGCVYNMDVVSSSSSSVGGPLNTLDFDFPLLEDEYDDYDSDIDELIKNLTPTMSLHNFTYKGSHSLEMMDSPAATTQRRVASDGWSDAKDRSIDRRLLQQGGNIELVVAGDDIQLKLGRFDVLFPDELEHSCLNNIDESSPFNDDCCEKQKHNDRCYYLEENDNKVGNQQELAAGVTSSNGSIHTAASYSSSSSLAVGAPHPQQQQQQKTGGVGIIRKLIRTLSTSAPGLSSLGINKTTSGTLPKLHDAPPPPLPPSGEGGNHHYPSSLPILSPSFITSSKDNPKEEDKASGPGSSSTSTNSVFSAIFSRTYSFSRKNAPIESLTATTRAPPAAVIPAPKSALANFLSLHSPLGVETISPSSHAPKRTKKFLF